MKTYSVIAGSLIASLAALCLAIALPGCNNSLGGFGGFVGNTPPTTPTTLFKVLGNRGTPFTLNISNGVASWVVPGTVPLNVAIVNNQFPVRMVANKTSNDNNLLSVEIDNGFTIIGVASTSAPYGVASVQSGGSLKSFAPLASPDLRIYVNGPFGERFSALIEDSKTGFLAAARAPAVFLFPQPNGTVDGQFTQIQNFGSFSINLTFGPHNGSDVVATASGGPFVIIRQP